MRWRLDLPNFLVRMGSGMARWELRVQNTGVRVLARQTESTLMVPRREGDQGATANRGVCRLGCRVRAER